jgi:hypothetical protein
MHKILNETLVFATLLFIILSLLFCVFLFVEMKINKNIRDSNSLAVIGHSHPARAIDDGILGDLISLPVNNYSSGGQSMYWSIIGGRKLKYQGVKYFIIELTNSTYTTGWKTTDNKRGSWEVTKKYFLNMGDWLNLFKTNFKFTIKLFLQPSIPKQKLRGGFVKSERKFKNKIVKENVVNSNISGFRSDFDDNIIHEFIAKNDSLFFIILRVPQHPRFYDLKGANNEKFYKERLNSFKGYDNCIIMDFGHKYNEDSLFADLEHMNYKGARVFTKFLSDTLLTTKFIQR